MNPYLEQNDAWEDFHHRFITYSAEMLNSQIGANYYIKIEVRLYFQQLSEEDRRYIGRDDVGVMDASESRPLHAASEAIMMAPVELTLPQIHVTRVPSLEICDRRDRSVVTAIELISPTNKASGGDLVRRFLLLKSRTHFVEIDLRRGGQRPDPPQLPPCDYYALVSRVEDRPRVGVWPILLRDRLPNIPIPLTAPDADVSLDLQALLNHVYDRGFYAHHIYRETPEPPLSPADAEWARQFVPAAS
jgi:hypothetical protein